MEGVTEGVAATGLAMEGAGIFGTDAAFGFSALEASQAGRWIPSFLSVSEGTLSGGGGGGEREDKERSGLEVESNEGE